VSPEERRSRLLEAASQVLAAAPDQRLNTVNLNKALFFLDLAALRDLGETITGNAYIALHWGPVIAKYRERLITALEEEGIAEQEDEGDTLSKPIRLRRAIDRKFIPEGFLYTLERVVAWVSSQSAVGISDHSHENPGWEHAYRTGLGSEKDRRPKSIDMNLALQQFAERDPWLDEPLSAEERSSLSNIDAERGREW
jgi:hypothetical protein